MSRRRFDTDRRRWVIGFARFSGIASLFSTSAKGKPAAAPVQQSVPMRVVQIAAETGIRRGQVGAILEGGWPDGLDGPGKTEVAGTSA